MPKLVHFGEFWKTEAYGQKVLPDKSLIGQKLVENAKIQVWHFESISDIVIHFIDIHSVWKSSKNSHLKWIKWAKRGKFLLLKIQLEGNLYVSCALDASHES